MKDVWTTRDLPVLTFVVEALQDPERTFTGGIRGTAIIEATGLDPNVVAVSLRQLEDAGLIKCAKVMGGAHAWRVTRVSAEALQLVGAWPTPESLAERILAELQAAAEDEPDEEKRGKLRAAVAVLGRGALDTGTNLLAAVIARAIGAA